ncbi:Snf5p [Sugiyamaella lignohabitans]|uniref:Snf5p n=1 Tax=Sugiyamaella lignohabitans TaxID=796027 RepID=A0A167C3R9_9ASCO|nr:Snf5p [Sugiyamaella lignohabitans]ANB11180.1 Snf5p [Sugiyamaella lignohabitans]
MSFPFEQQYNQFMVDESSGTQFNSDNGGSANMLISQVPGNTSNQQLMQQSSQPSQQQQFRNSFQFQGQPGSQMAGPRQNQGPAAVEQTRNVSMNQGQFHVNTPQSQLQPQSSQGPVNQAKYAQFLQQQLQHQQHQTPALAGQADGLQTPPSAMVRGSQTNQNAMVSGANPGNVQFQMSQYAPNTSGPQNQRINLGQSGSLGTKFAGSSALPGNPGDSAPGGPVLSASGGPNAAGVHGIHPVPSNIGAPVVPITGHQPSDRSNIPPRPALPNEILSAVKELPNSTLEEKTLIELLTKDAEQELIFAKQEQRHAGLIYRKQVEYDYYDQVRQLRQVQPSAIFGDGYSGYGNSWTGSRMNLIYPRDRKRGKRESSELFLSMEQLEYIASIPELLAPIRLDIDLDKYRLRDTFTWNLNEKLISVDLFAQNLAEDYNIPLSYAPLIANNINEVLNDFHPHAFVEAAEDQDQASSGLHSSSATGEESSGTVITSVNTSTTSSNPAGDVTVTTTTNDGISENLTPNGYATNPTLSNRNDDMRITIKLDITVGQHNLVDQFEWDLNCMDNNPEQFAEAMCRDLSLSGEFATAIAHAIREQTQLFTKTLFLVGHQFDGRPIEDDDIVRELCPPVTSDAFLRNTSFIKDFSPVLFEIPHVELDRQDKDRDRDSRRKRRQGRAGRRGGPTLPDLRETVRTFRTPVYSSLLPGGIDKVLELVRKQATKAEESDDDDDTPRPVTVGRRGRPPAHAQLSGVSTFRASPAALPSSSSRMASPQFRYHQQIQSVEDHYLVKLRIPPRIRDEVNRISL